MAADRMNVRAVANKDGEKWKVEVVVSVWEGHRPLMQPSVIILSLQGIERERKRTTNGKVRFEVRNLDPANYIVSVFCEGLEQSKEVKIEPEKKTSLVAETVEVSIGDGEILIIVNDKDHKPVPGVSGTVNDGGRVKRFNATDSAGMAVYKLENFTETRRTVEVRVGNEPSQKWCGVILNPKPTPTPAPKAP
ncbi:MAG: hypothetical protein A3C11_01915 [Candidatus Sungbacteria bacterium RIFCSPHIGHO2_02_FULL_49_12]|uniref:Big-1 domain-containing protein n=1 Tax=Candidatus Sungbacteria bacterium RIFCSPHIGHO2_02_FULL_49_12 TaxID=1802271 RepID=A0A1G2KMF3_9BACT|nr:MAG: hypothetical protein A3C11_01915 [Candidatus Sungbacteria bacterium RIFCSPHIGHO2_02_FULL_49_12]